MDGAAETLPQIVSWQLDFVIMRNPIALLDSLKLDSSLGRLLKMKFEFFLELRYFRVHAISLKKAQEKVSEPRKRCPVPFPLTPTPVYAILGENCASF